MNHWNESSETIKVFEGQEIVEGEWVEYVYDRQTHLGFTTANQGYNWIEVEEVQPIRKLVCVPKSYLHIPPFINYSWEESFILELANRTNDVEWKNEIIKEKSCWKSVGDFFDKGNEIG